MCAIVGDAQADTDAEIGQSESLARVMLRPKDKAGVASRRPAFSVQIRSSRSLRAVTVAAALTLAGVLAGALVLAFDLAAALARALVLALAALLRARRCGGRVGGLRRWRSPAELPPHPVGRRASGRRTPPSQWSSRDSTPFAHSCFFASWGVVPAAHLAACLTCDPLTGSRFVAPVYPVGQTVHVGISLTLGQNGSDRLGRPFRTGARVEPRPTVPCRNDALAFWRMWPTPSPSTAFADRRKRLGEKLRGPALLASGVRASPQLPGQSLPVPRREPFPLPRGPGARGGGTARRGRSARRSTPSPRIRKKRFGPGPCPRSRSSARAWARSAPDRRARARCRHRRFYRRKICETRGVARGLARSRRGRRRRTHARRHRTRALADAMIELR